MPLNDALACSKTYPISSDFFTVQAREFSEYSLVVLRRNAEAIIRDGEHDDACRMLLGAQMNAGPRFRLSKLQSVADQVLT